MDTLTAEATRTISFSCDVDLLADRLALAFRASSSKPALAALSGVLVRGRDNMLEIIATDGELSIQTFVQADVTSSGEAVLHRLFGDIVRSLPAGAVTVAVDEGGIAEISTERSRFTLRTYPRADFPDPATVEGSFVELSIGDLSNAIDQTVIAASNDKGRPILTGVLLEADESCLRLVATDSYRLAVRDLGLSGLLGAGESAILPARALAELSKLIAAGDADTSVRVGVGDKRVAFRVGDTTITTTRIEGEFPSYRQLLPERYPNRLEVQKDDLLAALRRVGLLAREATPVRLTLSASRVRLQAIDPEIGGEADEELEADYAGEEMTIAFNPGYFVEGVEACGGDAIKLECIEPLKPATVSSLDASEFRYLLMPVRV